MTTASLATLHSTGRVLEEERSRLASERDAARGRIKELELEVEELKKSELSLSSKVSDLEEAIMNLPPPSAPQDQRVVKLEKALKEAREKNQRAARAALRMKEKWFKLALEQVKIVNPAMESMRSVLSSKHIVEEGKIVKVDPVSKAKNVIYPQS